MKFNVTRVGNDGEGIAYYKNKPVYIYYAYLNEVVDADLITNSRGALEGKLNAVIKPSKHRVGAECPYYGICGGCNLMHISYEESLVQKRNVINFLLSSKLKQETKNTKLNQTHGSEDVFNYRNKINVPVKMINGKNSIGLFYRGTIKFLPIDSCIVEQESINELAKQVLYLMDKLKINAYDPKNDSGHIASLSIRTNLDGQLQLMINLKNQINLTKMSKELVKLNSNLVSVYGNFVPTYKTNRDILDGKLTHLTGETHLTMKLNDYKFLLTPHAFFQLNTKQAIKLYELVVKLGDFKKDDVVLDAYSGVGTIASFISPHVKEVVAIESIKAAVNDMDSSLKLNNIPNVKTITGDVIKVTNYLKKKFDVMVFDPPRIGLGETMVKYILKNKPKKVVYVSCNPKTLADDLKGLAKLYDIVSIDPFDMFPQTSQIESVTVLKLR